MSHELNIQHYFSCHCCLLTLMALQGAEMQWRVKARTHSPDSSSGSFPCFQSWQETKPLGLEDFHLLSFLCSLPYHKGSKGTKVSLPVPLSRGKTKNQNHTSPDNCPASSLALRAYHTSQNALWFPRQEASMQPRDI